MSTENEMALQRKQEDVVSRAEALEIKTQPEYENAVNFVKDVKALQKEIKTTFDPIVDKANKAHKEAVRQRNKFLDPAKSAEKTVKTKMSNYVAEQERKRREEEERLRKLAARREAEARRKAEEAAKLAEKKRLAGEEEEAAMLEEKAEQFIERANAIEAPVLANRVDEVRGVSYREGWDVEITDPAQVPRNFCVPDLKAIRAYVTSTKGKMAIEGVRIMPKKIPSIRG